MNILFLCSHNACRSILAEALFQMTSHADSAALAAIAERFPVKVADVANHQAKE